MNEKQKQAIMELLWEHLPIDREHRDRRITGWGTKTQTGLIACIERICKDDNLPDYEVQS